MSEQDENQHDDPEAHEVDVFLRMDVNGDTVSMTNAELDNGTTLDELAANALMAPPYRDVRFTVTMRPPVDVLDTPAVATITVPDEPKAPASVTVGAPS